jgi:hypothetical protein
MKKIKKFRKAAKKPFIFPVLKRAKKFRMAP